MDNVENPLADKNDPAVLDGMLRHVGYEARRATDFIRYGNDGWCSELPPPLDNFAQQSALEAALTHFRNLVYFLKPERPKSDQVGARDCLRDWAIPLPDGVSVDAIHSRLAHIGLDRLDASTKDPFQWNIWLKSVGPKILRHFLIFAEALRSDSPARLHLLEATDGQYSKSLIRYIEETVN
ncbi:MAG: hypothetical protein R2707_05110 [Acidimicrobiales bacterium]